MSLKNGYIEFDTDFDYRKITDYAKADILPSEVIKDFAAYYTGYGEAENIARVMIKDGFTESRINTIGLAMGKNLLVK